MSLKTALTPKGIGGLPCELLELFHRAILPNERGASSPSDSCFARRKNVRVVKTPGFSEDPVRRLVFRLLIFALRSGALHGFLLGLIPQAVGVVEAAHLAEEEGLHRG